MRNALLAATLTLSLAACSGITLPITDQTGNYRDNAVTTVNTCGATHVGTMDFSITSNLTGTPPNHTIRVTANFPTLNYTQTNDFVTPTTSSIHSPPLDMGVITGELRNRILSGTWHATITCEDNTIARPSVYYFARRLE